MDDADKTLAGLVYRILASMLGLFFDSRVADWQSPIMSIFLQSSNATSNCVHSSVKILFVRGHTISMRSECYEIRNITSGNSGELTSGPIFVEGAC